MNFPAQGWEDIRLAKPSAITLGNFDGVHLGHKHVLHRLIRLAGERRLEPVVLTFEPHPRHVFRPDDPFSRLASPAEKAQWLAQYPVQVFTLRFDKALAAISAESFARDLLLGHMQGQLFLLGHDHRFGAGAKGNADLLRTLSQPDWVIEENEPVHVGGEVVSSSLIRAHLEQGRLQQANALLGRPFSYSGQVRPGAGRARQMQVPTANVHTGCPEKVRVASGVYFGVATWQNQQKPALGNIGFSPTFGEQPHKVEVHIPGFAGDLYGQDLQFELLKFHRPERRFANIEELKGQIQSDLSDFYAFTGNPNGL